MQAVHGDHAKLPVPNAPGASALFVIPHSANEAFVWCPLADGGSIEDVQIAGIAAPVLDRKKLFRPGSSLEVLFIQAAQLRDGIECDLHVSLPSGELQILKAVAQLARWDNADTVRVLTLIANRFEGAGTAPVLERYLAFISVWQAPARLITKLSDARIVEVDVEARDDSLRIFSFSDEGFRSDVAQLLTARGGRIVLWVSDASVRHLYLDVAGSLVRVSLDAHPSASPAPSAVQDADSVLVEALHRLVDDPPPELTAWAATQCRPQTSTVIDNSILEVVRAVRLPSDEVALLLGVSGAACDLEAVHVEAFGVPEVIEPRVVTRDTEGESSEWQQQILASFPSPIGPNGCYRLEWTCAGQRFSVWIRETDATDPAVPALARAFRSVASVDSEVFAALIHPLATASDHYALPSRIRVCDFGAALPDPRAEIHVFVGSDVDAAHRTVLALFLTTGRAPIRVHLCLFDSGLVDTVAAAARDWSETYQLCVRMTCYSSRTTEAQVVRHLCAGPHAAVFVRAGSVPRHNDWLGQVLAQLPTEPVLHIGGSANDDALGADPQRLVEHRFTAAAVGPGYVVTGAGMPRFYSMEGLLLSQVIRQSETRATLPLLPELDFVCSDRNSGADPFSSELDSRSLTILSQPPVASRSHPRRAINAG
ncbi:hypothetical protein AAII07_30010 [Microvirga sp. 0TCS3.31]